MAGLLRTLAVTASRSVLPRVTAQRGLTTSQRWFAPAVTQLAPAFKGLAVVKGDFKEISLDDYRGKYLVLFFYPLDFTFVCPTELIAFSEHMKTFRKLNCEVVGVSTDSHFSHLAWNNMPRKGVWSAVGGDGVALRGLFLIDPEGIVRHMSVNDLPVGRSVEETLRLLKAFQFVAEHGEVCPANWQPESPTIKPDPTGSLEYFGKVN
ncbi:Thioredoxin-dependent peroxide reductase, mitochondrial [Chionoecetes opilio]|uniref:thioredoxin-dependent peroxiredoxin n=1 Tax=Chionoecetes opilio TaxID=41210 RepID=A0A8J5C5N0_CHIOP|nr:Thioredoxin-dependent peroxide reductase, mitochondrial [Chionoecetes opilio]